MITKNALVLTLGAITGCVATVGHAGDEVAPAPTSAPTIDPATAVAHVDENLAHLRALSVFEVGMLVIDAPQGAFNCYGPCPQFEKEIAAAKEKSAVRLERLVPIATAAAPQPSATACDQPTIDANLAALQRLQIVGVTGLVAETPQNNPQCSNKPCPADEAAAKAKTCERAAKLAGIAAAAKGL